MQSYDPMPVGETATFTFDFVRLIPAGVTISGVVCNALVYSAYSSSVSPVGMINTTASLKGTAVTQMVNGVTEGVFVLQFSATCSDGELILGQALLQVSRFA